MNSNRILAVLVFAATISIASADDYSGYIRLTGEDPLTAQSSWNKAGNWSDGKAPSSTKNYYVPAGALLYQQSGKSTSDDDRTWKGGQLVIGGTFHSTVNNDAAYGPFIQDLVLLGGSECRVGCFAFLGKVNGVLGSVTVEGTLENPAKISHHHTYSSGGSRSYALQGVFSGTSDSALVLTRPYTNYNNEAMDYGWSCFIVADAFATYPGTVIMRGGNFKAIPPSRTVSYNMPLATLRVEDGANCHFYRDAAYAASDAQIGALDSAGGKLYFNCRDVNGTPTVNPVVDISNRLNLDSDTVISIPTNVTPFLVGMTPDNPYGATAKIAHLASAAADGLGDISKAKVELADNARFGYPVKLHAIANGDGTKDVYLATPNVVAMTNQNSSSGAQPGAFDAGSGWMWTTLEVPAADSSYTFLVRKALTFYHSANYPNATLTDASVVWSVGGTQYTFKTINLCGSSGLRSWGTTDQNRTYSAEKLNILAASSTIDVSGSVAVTIDADICGEGDLNIGNYNNAYGSVHLTHANTNFHGGLTIQQLPDGNTLTQYKFSTRLSDSRNWGGEYKDAATAYKAITLKNFPNVQVQSDVSFSEVSRGILVLGGAQFNVSSGKTLTLGNQVTYAGCVEKRGSGTLELAGTARFLDGQAETAPIATTNVLKVLAGTLRISSRSAADGLAISFAEGTKLAIPSDSEAGYYNARWDAPLSIEAADGKLPVEVEPVDVAACGNVTVPICTFTETAAADVPLEAFSVSMDVKGMRLKSFVKQPNGDGTVSYLATFGTVGFRVIFR